MSKKLFNIMVATCGILGVAALMVSFSINPAPPTGATIPQIVVWGKQHETLILAGAWLQGIGSLLEVIFILAIIRLADAVNRLAGRVTAFAATTIMAVSLVEVSFYLSAVQGGVSGNLTLLAISLNLIQAIQHAYVIAPAPTLLIALGCVLFDSRLLPRIFSYLAIALGIILAILGFAGTFSPLQTVVDSVLTAQEVWFAAVAIMLIIRAGKVTDTILLKQQQAA